jgi:hypothetical protein
LGYWGHIDPKTSEPVVGIALPILDADTKQFLGVIRAIVRLTDLQQTISRNPSLVPGYWSSLAMGCW